MIGQTLIPVSGENELTFAHFVAGRNVQLIEELSGLVDVVEQSGVFPVSESRLLYFWADSGSGKTHLIHALCEYARQARVPCQFISMSETRIGPQLENSQAKASLVCVDNLDVICGDRELEIGFLSFYERVRAAGGFMVVAARKPPKEMGLVLADLVSRLTAGSIWQVMPMSDSEKRKALQQRASLRGFELNEKVIEFVMSHFARDTVSLFALLDQLDRASLAHQRRVTVPFVKEVIGV